MSFGSPKIPKQDNSALHRQNVMMKQSIDESRRQRQALSQLRMPEPVKLSPPSQQSAVDQAAAERMAKQNMANKKGIPWTINPSSLGGAGTL